MFPMNKAMAKLKSHVHHGLSEASHDSIFGMEKNLE